MENPECTRAVEVSLRAIDRWRVPPNWSQCDWREEARAQANLAALEADREYDASRGVPLGAYLHQRVMGSVLTRYRQEWRFARRYTRAEACPAPAALPANDGERLEELAVALGELPQRDLWLVGRIFRDGRTEAQVARELGVSQPAVSKRKQTVLCRLGKRLQEPQKFFRAGYIRAACGNVLGDTADHRPVRATRSPPTSVAHVAGPWRAVAAGAGRN